MAQNTPNLYILTGADGVQITYTPSDSSGKPDLNYVDASRNLSFNGDQVSIEQSALGSLVTVILVKTVDTGNTTFTVLIPNVNLGDTGRQPIKTVGIVTVNHILFAAPLVGQRQLYTINELKGTAQFI